MSEWNKPQWKTFSEFFLPEYNKAHGTKFLYTPEDAKVFNSDNDFVDPKLKRLPVQHTSSVGTDDDIDMEISRPKTSEKFINDLKAELKFRGINKCHIMLNISNPPRTIAEAREAVYWITELIQKKISKVKNRIYSFDQEEYDIYEKECIKWISEIDIYEDEELRLAFGWSKYPLEVKGVLDSEARFANALAKKESKNYQNAEELILLLDFDPFSFDPDDIDKFKKIVEEKGTKFKAIWVYQLWSGARGAFEIYHQ